MNKLATVVLAAVAVLTLGPAENAIGQSAALKRRLAEATGLDCRFHTLATGNWDGGTPGADVTATELEVAFSEVNADEGTAEAASQFGDSYIVVRYTGEYLHLMQSFRAGPLYVTTVLAKETTEGRLMAVHTRHEYTPVKLVGFTSRPEMYVGDCAAE